MHLRLSHLPLLIILLSGWSALASTSPSTVYVDDDYSAVSANDGHTWAVDAFDTIQNAYAAVAADGNIEVAAGTYTGYLTISKGVTINGPNAGIHPAVGMHASATVGTRVPEAVIQVTILPQASNITLDGLSFEMVGSRKIDSYFAGTADSFTIRNCIFDMSGGSGSNGHIQLHGSYTNLLFEYNHVTHRGGNYVMYTGTQSGNGDWTGLTMQYNYINAESEIVFWTAQPLSDGVFHANEFDGDLGGGSYGYGYLNIGQTTGTEFTNNYVHSYTYTGSQIGMTDGLVQGNLFRPAAPYPGYFGTCFELWGGQYGTMVSTNVQILDNTFIYNGDATSPIHALRFRSPNSGVAPAIDPSTITVSNNTFINLCKHDDALAVWNQGNQVPALNAPGNWWDTIDADEIDAAIAGAQSVAPWWLAPRADLFVDDDWAGTAADTVMSVSQVIELSDGTTYTHNASPVFGTTAFATLQDALDAALIAETIYVAAGDYGSGDTTWTVNQAQSIIGVQAGIDPTDSLNGRGLADTSGEANLSGAFIVDANVCRVLLGGLSMVYDPSISTLGESTSIYLNNNAGAVTVYHNLMADPTLDFNTTPPWGTHKGILTSSVGLTGLTVRQNLIAGYETAVYLNPNASDVVIDGNVIEDCKMGIRPNGTTNLDITDNAIEAAGGLELRTSAWSSGTSGDPSTGVVLSGNSFTQHPDDFWWYIELQDGEINTIGTLDASDNSFAGVAVSAMNTTQYSTLQANVVDRNDDASYGLLAFLQDPATLVLDDANGEPGDVLTITATLTSGGNPVSGKSILFKLDGSSIGSGTTNTSGVATFNLLIDFGAGDYDLAASFSGDGSHQGAADTATLSITGYGTPTSLTITPATASITADATQAFTAEASDGLSSWDVTAETDWTITAGAGGSFTANTYDAENTGSFTVYGTYDGLIGSAALTVTHGAAVSLAITPVTHTVDSGDTVTYTATATDADGNTWDASASAVFSDNGADGSFAANVYTAATPATVTISAGLGALTSNTATLTVNAGAAYIGNVLRFNVDNQAFKLGTLDVTADGWYDLGVPSGAQVYIDVTLASRSASATITQYDEDGDGDGHGDAVGVLANSLSCSFYYRYGTPYRLLQTSTVGGTSISGTYYSSYNKTSITGVGYVNGIQLLTNTFITTSNIQQSYTAAP